MLSAWSEIKKAKSLASGAEEKQLVLLSQAPVRATLRAPQACSRQSDLR